MTKTKTIPSDRGFCRPRSPTTLRIVGSSSRWRLSSSPTPRSSLEPPVGSGPMMVREKQPNTCSFGPIRLTLFRRTPLSDTFVLSDTSGLLSNPRCGHCGSKTARQQGATALQRRGWVAEELFRRPSPPGKQAQEMPKACNHTALRFWDVGVWFRGGMAEKRWSSLFPWFFHVMWLGFLEVNLPLFLGSFLGILYLILSQVP